MVKEFKIIVDLYSTPDAEGKQHLIKKNIIKRKTINIEDIKSVEQVTSEKGKIVKDKCLIEYTNDNAIIVKAKYSEVYQLINGIVGNAKAIGFKYKKRK